ncbi:MAG: S-layer homology domain-containing protein, partial [Propionibacteriaceae bacterium]|nr:S-layer homology domain-containing protein [Propionibacteriaceae bacterium]
VPATSDYYKFVEWLKTTGITSGTSATTFGPGDPVTRQQIAVFLYELSSDKLQCGQYPSGVGCILMTGSTPTISGSTTVGSTLTVNIGTWMPSDTVKTIQWNRNGTAIGGATGTTYIVAAADLGTSITVSVTGTRAGYSPVTKTSSPVAISAAPFVTSPIPTISGNTTVGSTLTATPGTWNPSATFTYQWYRGGAAIVGATAVTYALTGADFGQTMTVSVTGTRAGYTTTTRTSLPTASVTAGQFAAAPVPTISGSPVNGSTLTAIAGTWSPSAALTYQWYRNGVLVSGATAMTYLLTAADLNAAMTVQVTGTATGYVTTSRTSAATPAVQQKASVSFTAVTPYPAVAVGQAIPAGTSLISNLTYSATPTITCTGLPAGVTCNSTTGALSGTPATAGGYLVTVTAKVTVGSQPTATQTATTELLVTATSKLPVGSAPTQGVYPIPPSCTYPYSDACLTQYINDALRIEGYSPTFALPAGYATMSRTDQLIAATNAIRAAYGLPALSHNASGDASAQTGAVNDADPIATSSMSWHQWGSNWAGGQASVLQAMVDWVYQDGPGGNNGDCTATITSGCYGHRYNILATWAPTYIAAGYATAAWGPSYTIIVWK